MARHQNDALLWVDLPELADDLITGRFGQVIVEEDQVEVALPAEFNRVSRNTGGFHFMPVAAQKFIDGTANRFFIINDKNTLWTHHEIVIGRRNETFKTFCSM